MEPTARVEAAVRQLLDSGAFAAAFGEAHDVWAKAERLCWSDRSGERGAEAGDPVRWGTVIDVVQRQEHGASKEGGLLTDDDSRVAVFQTAMVMFELGSSLSSQQIR